MRRILWKKYY